MKIRILAGDKRPFWAAEYASVGLYAGGFVAVINLLLGAGRLAIGCDQHGYSVAFDFEGINHAFLAFNNYPDQVPKHWWRCCHGAETIRADEGMSICQFVEIIRPHHPMPRNLEAEACKTALQKEDEDIANVIAALSGKKMTASNWGW